MSAQAALVARDAFKAFLAVVEELNKAHEKLKAVGTILEKSGCDCMCNCHPTDHADACELCLACRIADVIRE